MSKYTVIVVEPCWRGDCRCNEYHSADPEVVGYPPYHDGCMCYVTSAQMIGTPGRCCCVPVPVDDDEQ